MKRKVLILLTSLLLSGVAIASGDTYRGKYPVASVELNGNPLQSNNPPPIVMDGTTVVPLQSIAEKLGAFVMSDEEDGKTIVNKPNINMIVASAIEETSKKNYRIVSPFMVIDKGSKASFDIFIDVDNAPKSDSLVFKIVIRNPSGAEEYVSYPQSYSTVRNGTAFLYTHNVKGMQFKEAGDYKVQLIMKLGGNEEYQVVGENAIHSR
ncbi:stalk domain-containing protein [Aneurinibacillus migulanus]|uniref:stalk domain-containing protein n=1 Tax=Aneurinibacillus migulanus TaxID=47500 RepID=UPI0020A0901F|nr:stalk domain-containing protein [Aneurinibacillus migulanus]MCP1355763.1 stalk domain-containing protein [Aneurinibacillus migulanus]MED4726594.1 stalk domain-containing protein [Aneurinibacillus migulanus]